MQQNYRSQCLVMFENSEVSVYKKEPCHVKEPFLILKPDKNFFGKSRYCKMTEMSVARDIADYHGNNLLVEIKEECYFEFVFFWI